MPMLRVLALISILTAAAACGDDNPTPTTPTTPTRTTTTETFAGTLNINGAATHSFATGSGQIQVTVTELLPDSTAVIGVSLGTWNGAACQIVIANSSATLAAAVLGTASGPGNFCAYVQDVGKLKAATDYKLEVVHF